MQANRTDTTEQNIVVAKDDLKRGDVIEASNLTALPIHVRKDSPLLSGSLIEYRGRGQELMGRRVNRNVQANEVITLADLLPEAGDDLALAPGEVGIQVPLQGLEFSSAQLRIGSEIGFVVQQYNAGEVDLLSFQNDPENADENGFGEEQAVDKTAPDVIAQGRPEPAPPELLRPFRLVAVGDQVLPVRDAGESDDRQNARVLTIAVKVDAMQPDASKTGEAFDSKTARLLKAAQQEAGERITNIVVLRP
ncbi:MAG: hypothetical protein RLZZ232_3110 [Planctomycetota bacterium]|jgi:hypothetical protein